MMVIRCCIYCDKLAPESLNCNQKTGKSDQLSLKLNPANSLISQLKLAGTVMARKFGTELGCLILAMHLSKRRSGGN